MSLFPTANAAYVEYFGTSPPSRATVAVPLPAGQRVRIEVVGFDDSGASIGNRSALHVQSLSYWAPANIGPYSQAVTVDSRLQIAGQIALLPPSLTLAPYPPPPASPYAHQATLALQHVRRIIDVLRNPNSTGGGWTGWVESCVAWWARPQGTGAEGAAVAQRAWKAWAEEVSSETACLTAERVSYRASDIRARERVAARRAGRVSGQRAYRPRGGRRRRARNADILFRRGADVYRPGGQVGIPSCYLPLRSGRECHQYRGAACALSRSHDPCIPC